MRVKNFTRAAIEEGFSKGSSAKKSPGADKPKKPATSEGEAPNVSSAVAPEPASPQETEEAPRRKPLPHPQDSDNGDQKELPHGD